MTYNGRVYVELRKLRVNYNLNIMLRKITDWLIERRKKQLHIPIVVGSTSSETEFKRVLNTLRNNKVMLQKKEDGIYIRMAGDESKGECFSTDFARVKKFD